MRGVLALIRSLLVCKLWLYDWVPHQLALSMPLITLVSHTGLFLDLKGLVNRELGKVTGVKF